MDYKNFTKKLSLPGNIQAPQQLTFEDLNAKPLTRADLKADLAAVNSSIDIIQKTRGGAWPQEELSEEFDLLDLAWHEREFRDKNSFAYVVYDSNNAYVGCFYLYSMGHRTEITEEFLKYEVDASWWVTTEAYERGYYKKLYDALRQWLEQNFGFKEIYYSNNAIPE